LSVDLDIISTKRANKQTNKLTN